MKRPPAPEPVAAPRLGSPVGRALWLAPLVALLGLTAWHALQRPALTEAQEAFDRAELATAKGKSTQARRDFQTALRRACDDLSSYPRSRASAALAARSLSGLIYADEAEPYYQMVMRHGPLTTAEGRDRAYGLLVSNRIEEALAACRTILETDPDSPDALKLSATILWFKKGRLAESLEAAEKLSRIEGSRVVGLSLLGTIHHEAKHPAEAVAAYEELLKLDPEFQSQGNMAPILWGELTGDLVSVGRPEEAKELLTRTSKPGERPVVEQYSDPILLDVLGSALEKLGDIAGAESCWRVSSRRDGTRITPYYNLGRVALGQKRFAEAAESLEAVLKIEPNHLDATYGLSRAYRFAGRENDARRLAERAEEIRRGSPPAAGGMGAPAS